MQNKYESLGVWLKSKQPNPVKITITDLECKLELTFPPYVHKYPWSNDRTQGLARAYMKTGYLVSQPDKDKEVLLFQYNPSHASELLNGEGNISHKHHVTRRSDVPTPSKIEVEKYLSQWDELENYHLQEEALNKLFFKVYPNNTDISDILIKVSCCSVDNLQGLISIFTPKLQSIIY